MTGNIAVYGPDKLITRRIVHLLRGHRFALTEANDLRTLQWSLYDFAHDIVVSDNYLSNECLLAWVSEVRSMQNGRSPYLVILINATQLDEAHGAIDDTRVVFIQRPVLPSDLVMQVRNLLTLENYS